MDRLLNLCCEAMCLSIEIGLPLRGAITSGQAAMRPGSMTFIGKPIVEAARMESSQEWLGASFGKALVDSGIIPSRFAVPFNDHVKSDSAYKPLFSGLALDWPLHWRKTRTSDLSAAVERLSVGAPSSKKYVNTLRFVSISESYAKASPGSRSSTRIPDNYWYFNDNSPLPFILIDDGQSNRDQSAA
jgi:hypothetical protein